MSPILSKKEFDDFTTFNDTKIDTFTIGDMNEVLIQSKNKQFIPSLILHEREKNALKKQ